VYLFIAFVINQLVNSPNAVMPGGGVSRKFISTLGMLPFLTAGFLVAFRTHPSGVFNSALVGIAAGAFAILYARMAVNEFPEVYSGAFGVLAGISSSLVLCALGGLLGGITKHYIRP